MPSNKPQPSLREKLQAILDDIDVTVVYRVNTTPQGYVGTKTAADKVLQLFESTMLEVINSGYAAVGKDSPALETVVRTVEAVKNIQRERLSALLGKEGDK